MASVCENKHETSSISPVSAIPELTTVDGLSLFENVISEGFQQQLLDHINSEHKWDKSLARRVQQYGFTYPYDIKVTQSNQLEKAAEFPQLFADLLQLLRDKEIVPKDYAPDQAIVNEYKPGQGIGAHTDNIHVFDDIIVSVTLGSTAVMLFDHNDSQNHQNHHQLFLQPGCVLVMSGEARYNYTHAIPKRKADTIDGRKVTRGTRVSITFRKIKQ